MLKVFQNIPSLPGPLCLLAVSLSGAPEGLCCSVAAWHSQGLPILEKCWVVSHWTGTVQEAKPHITLHPALVGVSCPSGQCVASKKLE